MSRKTAALMFFRFVPALLALAMMSSPATPAGAAPVLAASTALLADEPISLSHHVYLPLLSKAVWTPITVTNSDFEGGWWRETFTGQEFGELAVPEGWIAFWREGYPFGRPEMRVIPDESPFVNPPRIYAGYQALSWFTFYRSGDTGVYQQVTVPEGAALRATAVAHVWYSQLDDPHKSQWVDEDGFVHTIQNGDPGMDVMLGIDPLGGTDPWSENVVWTSADIYDAYARVVVATTAESPTVTLFLRTQTLYPFKHCDAYWDDVTLEALSQ